MSLQEDASPWRQALRRMVAPARPMWTTYFVADGTERVKIGRSRDVAARIRALESSTGRSLSLLGTIPDDVEGLWHHRWHACRIRGEWFRLTPSLACAIRDGTCRDETMREGDPDAHPDDDDDRAPDPDAHTGP
jgi:hypothetical protein